MSENNVGSTVGGGYNSTLLSFFDSNPVSLSWSGNDFMTRVNKAQGNGEICTLGSFTICTHHQILLGRSNQGE
jgi:hypothetical protein